MSNRMICQVFVPLLMLLAASSALTARAGSPDSAGKELVEKADEAELKLSTGKSPDARLAALKAFAQYLDDSLKQLPAKNPDDETRRLRASLWSFKGYVGKIDTSSFNIKKCPEYRAQILMGFSPHNGAPAYVPGEARETLKFLSLLCQKPELAEVPGYTPEPPPRLKTPH